MYLASWPITGVTCLTFAKVKELIRSGAIGRVLNVQIRFAVPPRDLDYNSRELPWRVQRDIAGGGYFYDLARISWICFRNFRAHHQSPRVLFQPGRTIRHGRQRQCLFQFPDGTPGSGSWCFVAHESAKTDRIEIIGDKGQICFSVFTYDPIALHTERGREELVIPNPDHVQLPLIHNIVEHLQKQAICTL